MKIIYLMLGGSLGTVSRYFVDTFTTRVLGLGFPHGTFAVNSIGCFLVGFLAVLSGDKNLLGPHGKSLLIIGFCGAFTTFSTLMLETTNLLRDGQMIRAFANVLLSLLVGFVAFCVGTWAARFF